MGSESRALLICVSFELSILVSRSSSRTQRPHPLYIVTRGRWHHYGCQLSCEPCVRLKSALRSKNINSCGRALLPSITLMSGGRPPPRSGQGMTVCCRDRDRCAAHLYGYRGYAGLLLTYARVHGKAQGAEVRACVELDTNRGTRTRSKRCLASPSASAHSLSFVMYDLCNRITGTIGVFALTTSGIHTGIIQRVHS